MSTVNLNEAPESAPIRFNHVLKLRCKEMKPHVSKAEGKRSGKFEFEIAEPNVLVIDGNERDITNVNLRRYISFEDDKLGTLANLHKAAGLPLEFEMVVNEDGSRAPADIDYTGVEFFAHVVSKQQTKTDSGGQPLTNPNTGEALITFEHDIREFLKR